MTKQELHEVLKRAHGLRFPTQEITMREVIREIVKDVPREVIVEKLVEVPHEVVREVIKEVPVIREVVKEVVREVPVVSTRETVRTESRPFNPPRIAPISSSPDQLARIADLLDKISTQLAAPSAPRKWTVTRGPSGFIESAACE